MPITIRCPECAQLLKVPDSAAGRRIKCPKCEVLLEIPVPHEPEPEAPAKRPSRLGKPSRSAVTNEQAPPSRRRTVVEREEDDEAPEEAEERPRRKRNKKRRKSSALLVLLLGGGFLGVLLCSGAGALAWWYFSGSSVDELKYMPNNCQAVISIRAEQMMQSQVFSRLRAEVPDIDKEKSNMSKEIGLAAEDIDQAVIGVGANSKDGIIVIRTRKAVTAADLTSRIQNARYTEAKVGKYLVQESQDNKHPTFCVVDNTHVVYGEKEPVRAVLLRDKKPDFSANLQAAMQELDFSKSLAVAVDVQSSRSGPARPSLPFGDDQQFLNSLKKINAVAVQVQVANDVKLQMTLLCQDAAAANDLKKTVDDFLAKGRNEKDLPKEIKDLLQLNLRVEGNKVTASTTLDVGPLVPLLKKGKGGF